MTVNINTNVVKKQRAVEYTVVDVWSAVFL